MMMGEGTFTGTERFQVLDQLGAGGMGVVYEVLDRQRALHMALKILRAAGPSQVLRLKDEFRAIRDIRHPNLIELGELFEDRGQWFFTMELVRGADFLAFVRPFARGQPSDWPGHSTASTAVTDAAPGSCPPSLRGHDDGTTTEPGAQASEAALTATSATAGFDAPRAAPAAQAARGRRGPGIARFDEARLRHALRGIGAGLAALHEAGMVHRDVKPSNVLVTDEGRVVLLDFGIAQSLGNPGHGPRRITGSPSHMAPEQAAGKPAGPAADWYAVGVILFEALTGQRPFHGKSATDLLARKLQFAPPRPGQLVPGLPSDLEELCAQLLATNPEDRPTEAELLPRFGLDRPSRRRVHRPQAANRVFVGRDSELEMLDAALRRARAGQPVAVVVEGESGVGKSSLVDVFLRRAAETEPGLLILRSRCHERESVPYKAFDGIVDQLSRHLAGQDPDEVAAIAPGACDALVTLFPVLAQVPGLAVAAQVASAPGDLRGRAFLALRELLTEVARRRTVLLAIDDIQWAEPDSLGLLAEVMSESSAPPLCLLATARQPPHTPPGPAVAAIGCDVQRIHLGGLSRAEASALAEQLLGDAPTTAGGIDALIDDAAGHPMFIAELAHHARARPGQLAEHVRLDDALLDRVARLDRKSRALLETIVVAGAPTEQAAVAAAAELAPDDFAARIASLDAERLVQLTGARATDLVAPYHDRVREAVYGHLGSEDKAVRHARLARCLEERAAAPAVLAQHFFRGRDLPRAAQYAEQAAGKASDQLAFDSAAELYRLAIDAGQHDATRARELSVALGNALEAAGRGREAAEAFARAARHADPALAFDLRRRRAEQLLMGGYFEEGLAAAADVLTQVGYRLPRTTIGAVLSIVRDYLRTRFRQPRWGKPALTGAAAERQRIRAEVCWSIGAGLGFVDFLRGAVFLTRGMHLAYRLGDPLLLARVACGNITVACLLRDFGNAQRMVEIGERAVAEDPRELVYFYGRATSFLKAFDADQDWPATVEIGGQGLEAWRAAGRQRGFEMDVALQWSCYALEMMGELPELRRRIDAGIRESRRAGNRFNEVSLRCYHPIVYLMDDDPTAAAADVRDAIDSWEPGRKSFQLPNAWALYSLANVMLYRGAVTEFPQLDGERRRWWWSLYKNAPWVRELGCFVWGRMAVAEAAAAARAGDSGRARRLLRKARRAARRLGREHGPVDRQFGLLLAAAVANVTGNTEAAARLLERALHGLKATHTHLLAAPARRRLGQTLGGQRGRQLIAQADAWMAQKGVRNPERMTAMWIPGW
jgi:eukaryotic-like serine/threonine-protein kinase